VSIHCKHRAQSGRAGAEVFYLSTLGASSRRAQALADLENRADLVGAPIPRAASRKGSWFWTSASSASSAAAACWPGSCAIARNRARASGAEHQARGLRHLQDGQHALGPGGGGLSHQRPGSRPAQRCVGRQDYADWLAGSVDAYCRKYPAALNDPLFARDGHLVYQVKRGDTLSASPSASISGRGSDAGQ